MDVVVGINVSKDRLDVHVLSSGESFVIANDDESMGGLAAKLLGRQADIIALEATGGYEMPAAAALSGAGHAVMVISPAQVRAYANALRKRAKTYPIDANDRRHRGCDQARYPDAA